VEVFDRRLVTSFDWGLLLAALTLSGLGIINIYSAGSFSLNGSPAPFFLKQIYWLSISFIVLIIAVAIDYQIIARNCYLLHGVCMLLLIVAFFWGGPTAGTHRWIQIGSFSIQPSEFAKVSLVIFLASSLSGSTPSTAGFLQGLVLPGLLTAATFLLVFLQPDLGTAGLLLIIFISLLFLVRLDIKQIVIAIVSGVALLPCSLFFLEEYQKRRIVTFLNPDKDSLRAGYQAIQSKIAIGSGMLSGKGFMSGTQSQLRFLPEQHTDFAFSVWAEEWGFFGSLVLLLLFFLVVSKGLKIASLARDRLGSLLAVGLVLILFWQVCINIGMVCGLFPIVGVPLPFVSYGGSSFITNWVIIGLLLNIRMRRLTF
jgi:rod shape determining protein RodA